MRKRINNFLNRPFPPFLTHKMGRIYYYKMIVIIAALTVIKPIEFINWHEYHEYRKSLVSTNYIFLFFGMYALLHYMLKYFLPRYYDTDKWTLKNEFQVLLFFFPVLIGGNCLYADFAIPEFELTQDTFLDLLLYNGTMSFVTIPALGYYVDTKLQLKQSIEPKQPIQLTEPTLPATSKEHSKPKLHLTEEQALVILQKLNELMDTQQLYLLKECNLQQVVTSSGIPRHHVSEAINAYSHKNFPDFINEYRCKHACLLYKKKESHQLSIDAFAEKCGFQNRVSYHNAFKKMYGISPSEYKERENIS
jgi:AraC-like DNA-binding protein